SARIVLSCPCPNYTQTKTEIEPRKKKGDHPVALRDAPYSSQYLVYTFTASFNPRSTFSGLNGNVFMHTPVALKMPLAMAAIGGTPSDFGTKFGDESRSKRADGSRLLISLA